MSKKITTIEELADMVQKEHEKWRTEMNNRFDKLEKEIIQSGKDLEDLKLRILSQYIDRDAKI